MVGFIQASAVGDLVKTERITHAQKYCQLAMQFPSGKHFSELQ